MKRTTEEIVLLVSIISFAAVCLFFSVKHVFAADARFCGVVYRNATTREIIRSAAIVRAFKREWPCVAPCDATWQVDHIEPLANGGCDSIINMQYLPPQIKSCAGLYCKDRWERILYRKPFVTVYK